MIFKILPLTLSLAFLASCGLQQNSNPSSSSKGQTLLITGLKNFELQKSIAAAHGLKLEGNEIVARLSGNSEDLKSFAQNNQLDTVDASEKIIVEKDDAITPNEEIFYLAKKDFNVHTFIKENPSFDGRLVKVGVVDDGISPNQQGFQKTTTGERKYIFRTHQSSSLNFILEPSEGTKTPTWKGVVSEKQPIYESSHLDLNKNKVEDEMMTTVTEEAGTYRVCIDINVNQNFEDKECFRTFNQNGEFGYWDEKEFLAFTAEFNPETNTLTLGSGEAPGDSHGEGVASVMAGHLIGGKFDGVAPGAQILDYDLSEASNNDDESFYTIDTFLKAFEILGKQGADVINVSYSLFFTSAQTQEFMQKAIKNLVDKYNFVISFSAGNNGPGLMSLNRRGIYPESVLVAGAYISKELDEYVHGVTGIPESGIPVYYSSRGPGPDLGIGPTVMSPLSSLTHSNPANGFRAFNGTSSASPALAGMAAILVSAIKNSNLPVDANTVVEAIRQSAEALDQVPYIVQGYGLPKVDKAFAIYKDMIAAKRFTNVRAKMSAHFGRDGVSAKGLLIRRSENLDTLQDIVQINGTISALAASNARINLLRPLEIDYSHDFLSGAQRLWLSTGASSLYLNVDVKRAFQENEEEDVLYGEIKVRDAETKEILVVVPVTLLNDRPLNQRYTKELSVFSQDGICRHFSVPAGTQGMRIQTINLTGQNSFVRMLVYNPSGVKQFQVKGEKDDIFMETKIGGWYQVCYAIYGGTIREAKLYNIVTPVKVRLDSEYLSKESIYLNLINDSAAMPVRLYVQAKPLKVNHTVFSLKDTASLDMGEVASGDYFIKVSPFKNPEMTYPYENCTIQSEDSEGKVIRQQAMNFSISENSKSEKIKINCQLFDHSESYDEKQNAKYLLTVYKKSDIAPIEKDIRLFEGNNEISLKAELGTIATAEEFSVFIARSIETAGDYVEIGTFSIY